MSKNKPAIEPNNEDQNRNNAAFHDANIKAQTLGITPAISEKRTTEFNITPSITESIINSAMGDLPDEVKKNLKGYDDMVAEGKVNKMDGRRGLYSLARTEL
jgi:hypothetical protein